MSRFWKSLTVGAALVLAAGCSELGLDVDQELEDQITMDVVAYAGSEAVDDVKLMLAESALFGGGGGPAALEDERDFSVSRSITFYDELGEEMDGFDALLTASVRIQSSIEGSRTRSGDRGSISVSVSRNRDVTISGLLGEETERQWDGEGSATENRVQTSDEHGTREYDMSSTTTIEAVVIPVPRGSGYPLSGTISFQVTVTFAATGHDTRTRERTVTVEFNGTRYVPITINGVEHTLDLETREIVDGA